MRRAARRRLGLAVVAVGALALLAGCGGAPGGEQLNQDATYDWNTTAVATYDVHDVTYEAIYRVDAGQELAVYQTLEIGGETSVSLSALRFRYENGSVLRPNGTLERPDGTRLAGAELSVDQRGERTVVTAPADGRIAYTAPTPPKSFHSPVLVEGSHEVILPRDMRISAPLLGLASPGGYERSFEGGRVHLRWSATPGGTLDLRYYLQRDFYIYTGLVGALLLVGAVGTVYFRRQLRELERRRKEAGIDGE